MNPGIVRQPDVSVTRLQPWDWKFGTTKANSTNFDAKLYGRVISWRGIPPLQAMRLRRQSHRFVSSI